MIRNEKIGSKLIALDKKETIKGQLLVHLDINDHHLAITGNMYAN